MFTRNWVSGVACLLLMGALGGMAFGQTIPPPIDDLTGIWYFDLMMTGFPGLGSGSIFEPLFVDIYQFDHSVAFLVGPPGPIPPPYWLAKLAGPIDGNQFILGGEMVRAPDPVEYILTGRGMAYKQPTMVQPGQWNWRDVAVFGFNAVRVSAASAAGISNSLPPPVVILNSTEGYVGMMIGYRIGYFDSF